MFYVWEGIFSREAGRIAADRLAVGPAAPDETALSAASSSNAVWR